MSVCFYLDSQPSIDSSVAKVAILQATGSPQGTGFPSISGQNSGTLRVLGIFLTYAFSAVYLQISRHCGKVKEVSDSSIGKSIMSENSMGGWPQLPGAQGNGPGPG